MVGKRKGLEEEEEKRSGKRRIVKREDRGG